LFLTNTVFFNTTSGSRKLPEYLIFASHNKFKTTETSPTKKKHWKENNPKTPPKILKPVFYGMM
jgi:hypothetical protein